MVDFPYLFGRISSASIIATFIDDSYSMAAWPWDYLIGFHKVYNVGPTTRWNLCITL